MGIDLLLRGFRRLKLINKVDLCVVYIRVYMPYASLLPCVKRNSSNYSVTTWRMLKCLQNSLKLKYLVTLWRDAAEEIPRLASVDLSAASWRHFCKPADLTQGSGGGEGMSVCLCGLGVWMERLWGSLMQTPRGKSPRGCDTEHVGPGSAPSRQL